MAYTDEYDSHSLWFRVLPEILGRPLTRFFPCILSRADSGKAVSRAEFEAFQAEMRRMLASPQQRGGVAEASVPVSVTLGHQGR